MQELNLIDSHTGGEPTRTIIAGGPELGPGLLGRHVQWNVA